MRRLAPVGDWHRWHDHEIDKPIVGWIPDGGHADDTVAVAVLSNERDARLLVDVLRALDARAVQP